MKYALASIVCIFSKDAGLTAIALAVLCVADEVMRLADAIKYDVIRTKGE